MRCGIRALAAASSVLLLVGCGADEPQAPESGSPGTGTNSTLPGPTITADSQASPHVTPTAEPETDEPATEEPEPQRASEASWDPDSIHVLVNRRNALDPAAYAPTDLVEPSVRTSVEQSLYLREEPSQRLEELFAHALEEQISLAMTSAYRSFDLQVEVYSARHVDYGTAATDEFAARPGYSEHQTGLAADVISIDNPECIHGDCFAETQEGQWVADHAHEFGFIIRYPENMEHITGYGFEPWHLRYVGMETAEEVYEAGLTLEEYWDQPPAPDYDEAEPNPDHLNYLP